MSILKKVFKEKLDPVPKFKIGDHVIVGDLKWSLLVVGMEIHTYRKVAWWDYQLVDEQEDYSFSTPFMEHMLTLDPDDDESDVVSDLTIVLEE